MPNSLFLILNDFVWQRVEAALAVRQVIETIICGSVLVDVAIFCSAAANGSHELDAVLAATIALFLHRIIQLG